MIEVNNINPLDWHGQRILRCIPAHFTKVIYNVPGELRVEALDWIVQNTNGRIGFENSVIASNDNPLNSGQFTTILDNTKTYIGFENPSDATKFNMFYAVKFL